jgi:hypothetical protein
MFNTKVKNREKKKSSVMATLVLRLDVVVSITNTVPPPLETATIMKNLQQQQQ